MRARPLVVATTLLALAVGGCTAGERDATGASSAAGGAGGGLTGDVTVFAAASLADAFAAVAAGFAEDHPDVTVTFSFGSSASLAQQVVAGAPADVLATASSATMDTVVEAGDTDGDPRVFARNVLQIAVPAGNPGGVTGLVDFDEPDRTIALCAAKVPCGAAAERVFAAAGITPAPDTLERDVRAALSKVQLGEVDAALVYRTDVLSGGESVEGIDVAAPDVDVAAEATTDYPVAVLGQASNPDAARAFVEYVVAGGGQEVLRDAGFRAP